MRQYTLVFITITVLLFSCEETIRLDLDQTEPVVVIEGLITNQAKKHFIKVSRSTDFYASQASAPVSGAQVRVEDDLGNQYLFEESTAGRYESVDTFSGLIGRTYRMQVVFDGKTYEASEKMYSVTTVDSLTYRVAEGQDSTKNRFLEVLVYLNEPQDEDNYYLAKFFRNGERLDDEGTTIFYFNDDVLNGRIQDFPIPDFFAPGDRARAELFSISAEAFRFFSDQEKALNNDGGLFSGIPANAHTNLEGGAIGYFQVSAMEFLELVIE